MKNFPSLLLVVAFVLFAAGNAFAKVEQNHYFLSQQENILNNWLSNSSENISEETILYTTERALSVDMPYFAEKILSAAKPQPETITHTYLNLLIAIKKHDISKAEALTEKLVSSIMSEKNISSEVWENRLVKIWQWHRDNNNLQFGRNLFDKIANHFADWPDLAVEHMIWQSFFEPQTEIIKKATIMLDGCTGIDSCLAPIALLDYFNLPVLSRYYLYKGWKLAKNTEELFKVLKTALLIKDDINSVTLLKQILETPLTLDVYRELLTLMPEHKAVIIEKLLNYSSGNMEGTVQILELLWSIKAYPQIKSIIPVIQPKQEITPEAKNKDNKKDAPNENKGKAAEKEKDQIATKSTAAPLKPTADNILPISLDSYKFLSKVVSSKIFANDQKYYEDMLIDLADKLIAKNMSETEQKLFLLYTGHALINEKIKKHTDELLKKLSGEKNFKNSVILFKYYLATKQTNQSQAQFSTLVNQHKEEVSIFNEIALLFYNTGIVEQNGNIRVQWVNRLKSLDGKQEFLVAAQAADIFNTLNKTREAQDVIARISNAPLKTKEKLQLAKLVVENYNPRVIKDFIKSISAETNTDEQFCLLSLSFRLDLHEKALRIFHKITTEEKGQTPLAIANRLLKDYLVFKDNLTYIRRYSRISLDIYTNLILQLLRQHLDNSAIKQWPLVFTIAQQLQTSSKYNASKNDRQLRQALYETNVDVDTVIFDFYNEFSQIKNHPFESWIAIADVLAKNQNPDFFSVIWEQIKIMESDNNIFSFDHQTIKSLLSALLSSKNKESEDFFITLCDKWQNILTHEDNSLKTSEAAYLLSAIYHYHLSSFKADKSFHDQNLAAISKNIKTTADKIKELDDKAELPFRRARITITEDVKTHDLSAKTIHTQTMNFSWYFADCLAFQIKAKDQYNAYAEITTDYAGRVSNVSLRGFPTGLDEEKKCLETYFYGFVYDNIEPPFGFGKIHFNSTPTDPNGISDSDREIRKEKLLKLQRRFKDSKELFEQEQKQQLDFLGNIFSYAKSSIRTSLANTYDDRQYLDAAWWYKYIANDSKSHARLLNERIWIMSLPYITPLIIAAILLGLYIRRRKRK